jgi:hypothetical protein
VQDVFQLFGDLGAQIVDDGIPDDSIGTTGNQDLYSSWGSNIFTAGFTQTYYTPTAIIGLTRSIRMVDKLRPSLARWYDGGTIWHHNDYDFAETTSTFCFECPDGQVGAWFFRSGIEVPAPAPFTLLALGLAFVGASRR